MSFVRYIFSAMLAGFLMLMVMTPIQAATDPEPDTDRDSVSDYDDYCPRTPAGYLVWTMNDYYSDRVALQYVGCASYELWDPNYRPPQRPQQPLPPRDPSLFDQIEAMFQAGTPVDLHADLGWYSGRCYGYSRANVASGSLLWIESRNSDGPAFPAQVKFAAAPLYFERDAAKYDELSITERLEVEKDIQRFWPEYSLPDLSLDGISSRTTSVYANQHLYLRRNGDYLVLKRGVRVADSRSPDHRPTDGITDFCYFFKKL